MNVIWTTRHPETTIARGYWDQALLEDLLAEHPARHLVGFDDLPGGEGAVVVLPARHHAGDLNWVNRILARLPWAILVLTGDEEHDFPWRRLKHQNLRLWIQTPERFGPFRCLPNGYAPHTRPVACLATSRRVYDWFFAGQITHPAREQMATALRSLPDGRLVETPGFTQGLPTDSYQAAMNLARVAPAPPGPVIPDTFRAYEALESGAVPVVGDDPYWTGAMAEHPPFPRLGDWSQIGGAVSQVLARWPWSSFEAQAWWIRHKRRMAGWLAQDLASAGGVRRTSYDDQISVLIPTSPAADHPSTQVIEETVASIRANLPRSEILLTIDGVPAHLEHRRAAYEEYVWRLLHRCNYEWARVTPLVFPNHQHQSGMLRGALPLVATPYLLYVEHDAPLVGQIDWPGLVQALESRQANVIRLHHEAAILAPHRHLMLDETPTDVRGAPLLRTAQWSQRPHLARTDFYRDMAATYFGDQARTMIEDVMHGVLDHHWRLYGDSGWGQFQVWIYAPPGDMKRSGHLDARGADAKGPMVFAYDGEVPEGAPNPQRDEEPAGVAP